MSYFNPATIPAELAYNCCRGVRNLSSGTRTRQTCGFFIPPRRTSVYGREGMGIPEYHPPFLSGSEPPSRPFWASLLLQKTVRTPAMLACPALYPVSHPETRP